MADDATAKLIRWLPVILLVAGIVSTASIAQFQIQRNATDVAENGEAVEENEDAIELIQRLLIQRQGEVQLDIQRIQTEQRSQGEDLDEVLQLLKGLARE